MGSKPMDSSRPLWALLLVVPSTLVHSSALSWDPPRGAFCVGTTWRFGTYLRFSKTIFSFEPKKKIKHIFYYFILYYVELE